MSTGAVSRTDPPCTTPRTAVLGRYGLADLRTHTYSLSKRSTLAACRRHVAADDSLWAAVDERCQELLVPAMGVVTGTFERFEDRDPPFDVDMNEMAEYAMDKVGRRLEAARGANLRDIDADASPEQLEERFHAEDQQALAAAS
ncbi:MAG: hypothetical protein ACRDRK_27995 [Pseudonocardia sp.]